ESGGARLARAVEARAHGVEVRDALDAAMRRLALAVPVNRKGASARQGSEKSQSTPRPLPPPLAVAAPTELSPAKAARRDHDSSVSLALRRRLGRPRAAPGSACRRFAGPRGGAPSRSAEAPCLETPR